MPDAEGRAKNRHSPCGLRAVPDVSQRFAVTGTHLLEGEFPFSLDDQRKVTVFALLIRAMMIALMMPPRYGLFVAL